MTEEGMERSPGFDLRRWFYVLHFQHAHGNPYNTYIVAYVYIYIQLTRRQEQPRYDRERREKGRMRQSKLPQPSTAILLLRDTNGAGILSRLWRIELRKLALSQTHHQAVFRSPLPGAHLAKEANLEVLDPDCRWVCCVLDVRELADLAQRISKKGRTESPRNRTKTGSKPNQNWLEFFGTIKT